VSSGRPAPRRGAVVLLVVLACVACACGACARAVDGVPTAAQAAPTPGSAADLEAMLITRVPSGLPRLEDDEVRPRAGEKDAGDVAEYSGDPLHEREVLEDYGYRFGWERFWGSDSGPMTSVFVDQFDHRSGASAYARDLARNEAGYYGAALMERAPELPGGCHLLTVDGPDPQTRLAGPAALAWCGHGVFSVSATVVADSVSSAQDEVAAVLEQQLARLPPR
jgi:hypothetical protein